MTEADIGRAEERKAREAGYRKLAQAIRDQWYRTGHDPEWHLRGILASGEAAVLDGFQDAIRFSAHNLGVRLTLATWLAVQDMGEIKWCVRLQELSAARASEGAEV